MKLNQFIASLLEIVEKNPELAEIEVITFTQSGQDVYHSVHDQPLLAKVDIEWGRPRIIRNAPVETANAIIIN